MAGSQKATEARQYRTLDEREAAGREARKRVPRAAHADWKPAENRPDPIDLLERQATSRVPELLPIRYGRMSASPFAFYRGAAYIMASDLAETPTSGFDVQLCGDAHLSNFGGFESPERRLVFDINDFDETLPGPWEWDVKRLATSFEIAGRQIGLKRGERSAIVARVVEMYRTSMADFAKRGNLDTWYAHLDIEDLVNEFQSKLGSKRLKAARKTIAKAKAKNSLRALGRLVECVDGQLRFISNPPVLVPVRELATPEEAATLAKNMKDLLAAYRATLPSDRQVLLDSFRMVDMARKVVGVGSVGTRAWVILMVGRDENDPLMLQVKEAGASVLEEFLGSSTAADPGQRVVEGQRLMQASGDIMLGWLQPTTIEATERHYYVRQLWDGKASAEVELMSVRALDIYARMCGWTLARAHARSGDRVAIATYLGKGDEFDRAIAEFANTYADQNEVDYRALQAAIAACEITAVTGI